MPVKKYDYRALGIRVKDKLRMFEKRALRVFWICKKESDRRLQITEQ
jgi:hypothetical protein